MLPTIRNVPTSVTTELAFTRREHVSPDAEHAGMLRARSLDLGVPVTADTHDVRRCRVYDCLGPDAPPPSLAREGFAHLHLPDREPLTEALARACATGELDADLERIIRRALTRRKLRMGDGRSLRVLYIAPDGFIMRRAGPNGMRIDPHRTPTASNHHHAAAAVHIDQDIDGTPLRQILKGVAPRLFHHVAPAHANRRSRLHLLNVWIPLQQPVAPLALMDGRTLDRARHQLRFGLPVDSFMARKKSLRVNDIWTVLHHPDQRWYFTSEMESRAYVFETLSTPHGAFVLPGEARAEALYRAVGRALEAVQRGSSVLASIDGWRTTAVAPDTTDLLRVSLERLEAVLHRIESGEHPDAWVGAAATAMDGVVRKSIEMRVVARVR
jgi:hypothetical protein